MKAIGTDIIGREKEVGELLSILDQTSVIMSSTRRMGKTMILNKIGENQGLNLKSMLCFVESIQSAEEFEIMKILSDLFEDMYVDKSVIDDTTSYQFRFILLKKWWKSKYA